MLDKTTLSLNMFTIFIRNTDVHSIESNDYVLGAQRTFLAYIYRNAMHVCSIIAQKYIILYDTHTYTSTTSRQPNH